MVAAASTVVEGPDAGGRRSSGVVAVPGRRSGWSSRSSSLSTVDPDGLGRGLSVHRGFSTVAVIPAAAFRLTKGTPRRFTVKGDSGRDITRNFCDTCGTPLFSEPPGGAIWVVKAGTLDDPSWLKLSGNLYTKSAQPWAHIDPGLLQFEKMPPGAP